MLYSIDLFAGCGGLSLGLENAGFNPLFVSELNTDALNTYLNNREELFPHLRKKYKCQNIKDVITNPSFFEDFNYGITKDFKRNFKKDSVDLLVGGPPCQGFSGIGIRRSYSVDKVQLPSNHLYEDMAVGYDYGDKVPQKKSFTAKRQEMVYEKILPSILGPA